MSRGAEIPIRTFSPITDRTDTSMSSPIMMLWLDFLVRTSILRASLLLPSRTGNPLKQVRPRDAMKTSGSVELTAGSAFVGAIHPAACNRLRGAQMARVSLRPQLNQIRTWVRQGRTDAWIAHQLEVTVQQIEAFRRDNDLGDNGDAGTDYGDEIDLRAEDDALIAAELDAAEAAAEQEPEKETSEEGDDDEGPKRRRGGRRGGRGRRRSGPSELEGTFDHGEEGYGLWLDPAIQDDPIYAEHWAGPRTVRGRVGAGAAGDA